MPGLLILFGFAAALICAAVTGALIFHLQRPQRKTYANALARDLPTSPADVGLQFQEHTIAVHDNTQTTLWVCEGTGPAKRTFIVLHGYGDSRYGSLSRLPMIQDQAGKIIVADLRAHGDTTSKISSFASKEHLDVLDIVENFCDEDEQVILYGHSFGSAVSIATVRAKPERFAAVIADGPYKYLFTCIARTLRWRRYPPYPFAWLADWHFRFWYPRYRQYDPANSIRDLTCPILVVHGDLDPIAPIDDARQLAHRAKDGKFVEIKDGGHGDLHQVDPDQYREELLALLDKLPPIASPVAPASASSDKLVKQEAQVSDME